MNIDSIRNIDVKKGIDFLCLKNSVGQEWLFPVKNTYRFLSLYFPSSIKGKIVRFLLPLCAFLPFLRKICRIEKEKFCLPKELDSCIKKVFNLDSYEFAVFGGSPCAHQKMTLMIMKDNRYLGYCKLSDNKEMFEIFRHESEVLNLLKNKGVDSIPSVLFCDELKNGLFVFVQTTERAGLVRKAMFGDKEVFSFLNEVKSLTSQKMDYLETDFCKTLKLLKSNVCLLGDKKDDVLRVIDRVEEYLVKNKYEYCVYHGDFTPWNSFIVNDRLFVFDFEYSQKSYPIFLDFFHFFTQTHIYDNYMSKEDIWNEYVKRRDEMKEYILNVDFYYSCYLLGIMSFYLFRDNGFLNERLRQCFETWLFLLFNIEKNYEIIE